jgi:5-aminolevulinate synthase
VAASLESVRVVRREPALRTALAERAAALKRALDGAGLPRLPSPSHIVPVPVPGAGACRAAARRLLAEFDIYATPIDYPTVPRGEERLRLCATPFHMDATMDALVRALREVLQPAVPRAA